MKMCPIDSCWDCKFNDAFKWDDIDKPLKGWRMYCEKLKKFTVIYIEKRGKKVGKGYKIIFVKPGLYKDCPLEDYSNKKEMM